MFTVIIRIQVCTQLDQKKGFLPIRSWGLIFQLLFRFRSDLLFDLFLFCHHPRGQHSHFTALSQSTCLTLPPRSFGYLAIPSLSTFVLGACSHWTPKKSSAGIAGPSTIMNMVVGHIPTNFTCDFTYEFLSLSSLFYRLVTLVFLLHFSTWF